jgi:RNA polymerase sigma factor (sigma-70 family)
MVSLSNSIPLLSQPAITNEERLIHAAQHGDLEAFNQLVLAYQDRVYRQALWILGEVEEAEDAAQEAFMRAYLNLGRFYGATFKAWLLRIVTNYCLDLLRRQKTHPKTHLDVVNEEGEEFESASWMIDPCLPIEALMEEEELMATLRRCLERLDPDYRVAVILVDIQEFDYQEAAQIVGVCLGTFKSRLSRARVILRNLLKEATRSALSWELEQAA